MAKNLNITTANGTFTLTGSKKMIVKASGGNLVVDINGDGAVVKSYPLASIIDYDFSAVQRGGENRWITAEKDAVERLALELADLRKIAATADDDTLMSCARLICAAIDARESARTRGKSYAAALAKGKEKRAAKKAAAVEPASIIDPTFASDAALAALAAPKAAVAIAKVTKKSAKKSA